MAVVAGVVAVNTGRDIARLMREGEWLEEEKRKLADAQEENKRLTKELEGVQTEEFVERQAREKLGLGKEGEVVVVFQEDPTSPLEEKDTRAMLGASEPNWRLWRKLYLGF